MLKKILASVLFIAALFSPLAQAQLKYLPGRDYEVLQETLDNGESPKIIEFFWYGCPHCYDFEGVLKGRIQDGKLDGVPFEKVPAVSYYWKTGAQLYYAAHALNLPNIDEKVFDAAHKSRSANNILSNEKAAIDFLVENGADRDQATRVWNSLAVKQKVNRAQQLFDNSHATGVPALIVNGIYLVSVEKDFNAFLNKALFLAKQKSQ